MPYLSVPAVKSIVWGIISAWVKQKLFSFVNLFTKHKTTTYSSFQWHIVRMLCQPPQELWNQLYLLVMYQVPFTCWHCALHWVESPEATEGLLNSWWWWCWWWWFSFFSFIVVVIIIIIIIILSHFQSVYITSCKIWQCIPLLDTLDASHTPRDEVQSFCIVYQTLYGVSEFL